MRSFDHEKGLAAMRAEWTRVGETLFAGPTIPSRAVVTDAALRVLYAGVRAAGSITAGAEVLRTSRRGLRDIMKRLGVYEVTRG